MPILPDPIGKSSRSSTKAFVAAIERRHAELCLKAPWSIAELRLDNEDFVRLNAWAEEMSGPTIRELTKDDWSWFDPKVPGRPRRASVGLLLLAVAAEAARREATEATLWRYIRRRPDGELRFAADSVLFNGDGQSAVFNEAVIQAVQEFGLRNATDVIEGKRYYSTVFLQFGFGLLDARKRLAGWLSGQTPQMAIEALASRDHPLGSESFASFWRDLRHGRGRLMPPGALLAKLRTSPWILPGWAEELIEIAGRSLPSGSRDGKSALNVELESILEAPRLRWPGGMKPHFSCKIASLSADRLEGNEYTLRVDRRIVARIDRDGMVLRPDRDHLEIPGFPAIATVELRDEDSGEAEALTIECFDPREIATLYDLGTGRPVAAGGRPVSGRRYALVYADDLTLSPEAIDWAFVRSGPLKLRVAALAGDASTAKLTLGDATVWELGAAAVPPNPPGWARVTLGLRNKPSGATSVPIGTSHEVTLTHSADVRVAFVRRGLEPFEPKPKSLGITFVGPIPSTSSISGKPASWLIGLERSGEIIRVIREFDPDRHGGAIHRGDVWEAMQPESPLDAGEAGRSPLFILPPMSWDGRRAGDGGTVWALMEGEHWVACPGLRPRIIPSMLGLGGRLTVRLGPFNATEATPPDGGPKRLDALILADRVVDRGIVRSVYPPDLADDGDHTWRIELEDEVEIDGDHEVHWWDRSGEIHHLNPTYWSAHGASRRDWWAIDQPGIATEPRALLVTFKDRRLGAWWTADWAANLEGVAEAREPEFISALIAWFKLPVLEGRSVPEIRRLATRWPAEILRAWLAPGVPEGWRFAIRAAFQDWKPGPAEIEAVGRACEVPNEIPEVTASLRLLEICPTLMGRYLRARLTDASAVESRAVIGWLRGRIERSLRFEIHDLVGTDETYHDGIERVTKLNDLFLKSLNRVGIASVLGLTIDGEFDQRANLDLAVTQFVACRLLLALDILDSLEAGKPTHWKGGRLGTA